MDKYLKSLYYSYTSSILGGGGGNKYSKEIKKIFHFYKFINVRNVNKMKK